MNRNPKWTRDELILALDLYFRVGRKQLDPSHPDVIQLSRQLNQLSIHDRGNRNAEFRNPQGVSMKLGNFLALDPEYSGLGLQRGGRLDREIWGEFEHDIHHLQAIASAISAMASWTLDSKGTYRAESEEEEFPEGRTLTRLHTYKERNRAATTRKKRKVLQEKGALECEACGFDFARSYGALGVGFAECHHMVPISELKGEGQIRLSDLRFFAPTAIG